MDTRQRERLTQVFLILEFGIIVLLVWAVSLEYRSNQYMQAWINEHASFLGYLLNGYLAAMLAGVLVGSIVLFVQNRPRKGDSSPPSST